MRQGALSAVKADEEVVPISEVKALKTRIRELERLLGRKTMEVEILKKALEVGREKNCYCACPYLKRTIPREDGYGDIGHFPVAPV
jgi:transposase